MFYVHYKIALIHCVIVITPHSEVFVTYMNSNSDKYIIKIHSYASVKQIIKTLTSKGKLDLHD